MLQEDAYGIISITQDKRIRQQVFYLAGRHGFLLSAVNRGKLSYSSAMSVVMTRCRRSYNRERHRLIVRRHRGRSRKSWQNNVKEWTGKSMSSWLRIANDKSRWAATTSEVSVGVPPNDACMGVTDMKTVTPREAVASSSGSNYCAVPVPV